VKDTRDTVADELKEDEKLQSLANEKEHGGFNHKCYMLDAEKKLQRLKKKLSKIHGNFTQKQAELKNIQEALANKVKYNIKILEEMDKLNAIEQTPENKKNQLILQVLVSLNKNFKDQINLFKGTCQRERVDWQKKN